MNAFGSSMDMSTMRMVTTMARLSHGEDSSEQKRKLKAMKPAVLNKCRDKIREVFESFAPVEIYSEDFQFHSIPLRKTFKLVSSSILLRSHAASSKLPVSSLDRCSPIQSIAKLSTSFHAKESGFKISETDKLSLLQSSVLQ